MGSSAIHMAASRPDRRTPTQNVILTLTPWPLPVVQKSVNESSVINSPEVCRGGRFIPQWNISGFRLTDPNASRHLDPTCVTVTDDQGNSYPVSYTGPDQSGQIYGVSIAAQTINAPTSFTATLTGQGGETASSTISVSLIPFSTTISVDTDKVVAGQPVTLTWGSVGAQYAQFSAQIQPAGQPPGPVTALDARGGGPEPALIRGGWPSFPGAGIGTYPADCYPSGSIVIYPQVTMTLFLTATSSNGCGTTKSNSVMITVTYPTDAGEADAGITAGGTDVAEAGGAAPAPPVILRRSCLSAPGSRYCRAEDTPGGGIRLWRGNGPVPKLTLGTLWEVAGASVTANKTDSQPALFLDPRGALYCAFARVSSPAAASDGVFYKRSDDHGATWGAALDAEGHTELMAIPGGMLPAVASGGGGTLVAAITGTDKTGYKLLTCYKSAGDAAFSAPVIAVDETETPLAVQNSGIGLCRAAEGPKPLDTHGADQRRRGDERMVVRR